MNYPAENKNVAIKRWGILGLILVLFVVIWKGKSIWERINNHHVTDKETTFVPSVKKNLQKLDDEQNLSKKLFKGATKIILTELNKYEWKNELKVETLDYLSHELFYVKEIPEEIGSDRRLLVIIFTNSSPNYCHGCAGRNSLFEFKLTGKTWKLFRKDIAFSYGDEFGFPPRNILIVNLGPPGQYGILIKTGFSAQGYDDQIQCLYTHAGGKLKDVFSFTCYSSNSGANSDPSGYYDFTTIMKLVKGKGKFFDIVLSGSGDFGRNEANDGKRFVFNGSKYIEGRR